MEGKRLRSASISDNRPDQLASDTNNSSDISNSDSKRNEEIIDCDKQIDDEDSVSKQLRMLSYDAGGSHGKFMEDFDPERSGREMRKMNRRIYRENKRKNQLYDETGRLFDNSKDLCDCLDLDCPGCHLPCAKCGSEKCGTECRCNRKWVYENVEVEGTDIVITWPS